MFSSSLVRKVMAVFEAGYPFSHKHWYLHRLRPGELDRSEDFQVFKFKTVSSRQTYYQLQWLSMLTGQDCRVKVVKFLFFINFYSALPWRNDLMRFTTLCWGTCSRAVHNLIRKYDTRVPPEQTKLISHHNGDCVPYSFRTVCGSHTSTVRRGLQFTVHIREDLRV